MIFETIGDIFDAIYDKGALIIKPAEDFEIERCRRDTDEIGIPRLPEEYEEFLKVANGFAWNGFEFFGTYEITVKKTGYVLVDIINYNMDWRSRKKYAGNRIALGRFDEDIYSYNADTKMFESLDSLTLIQVEEYESFEEMLLDNISEYVVDDEEEDDE